MYESTNREDILGLGLHNEEDPFWSVLYRSRFHRHVRVGHIARFWHRDGSADDIQGPMFAENLRFRKGAWCRESVLDTGGYADQHREGERLADLPKSYSKGPMPGGSLRRHAPEGVRTADTGKR